MEVYVDMLIMENFIVVYFLLTISFKIIRFKVKTVRKVLASFIGGIYTLSMIIPEIKFLSLIPFQIVVSILMVSICTGISKKLSIVKGMLFFYLSSFLLSGICFAFSLMQNDFVVSSPYTMVNYSLKYTLLAIMIIYMLIDRIVVFIKDRAVVENLIYDIEIINDGSIYEIKAFLDTGNELREPITNLPCIIVEENSITKLLKGNKDTYHVPYSAIGYDGKLIGVKVERVRIGREKGKYKEINAIVCPCKNILSKDGEFNALLSRGVIV